MLMLNVSYQTNVKERQNKSKLDAAFETKQFHYQEGEKV